MSRELFTAITQHDTARVEALLSEGANPNEPRPESPGLRPLHVAIYELAEGGELDVVRALLHHGADVNAWDVERDRTPLLVAVCENELEAAAALVKVGAEPNVRSSDGITPLRSAAEDGNLDLASLLLDAGATRTINDWGGLLGLTALGIAIEQLDLPMMKLLLDAGADPDAPDDSRRPTRERMPPREESNAQRWDTAAELLRRSKGRHMG